MYIVMCMYTHSKGDTLQNVAARHFVVSVRFLSRPRFCLSHAEKLAATLAACNGG